MNTAKIAYKPVGMALGAVSGALAGVIFKRVWRLARSGDDPPRARDADRHWGEILAAAAVQGAIFAVVKAAIDRGGASGFRRISGSWPG